MQRTPFIIHGNASLARAYRLFRTMGLHHLYVGPPKPPIIGVLTRKVGCPAACRAWHVVYPALAALRGLHTPSKGMLVSCAWHQAG